MNRQTVAAATLAYSRLDGLMNLVDALRNQTRAPDAIIVINQGDNAQIQEWLEHQDDLIVVSQENRGSAGGFSRCLEESLRRGFNWTWILDDDSIPARDALQALVENVHFDAQRTGFLSSRIVDASGATYMSPIPDDHLTWYGSVLQERCVKVIRSTWLGMLVSSKSVIECGLPIEEFVIWHEDQEFSARIARKRQSFCVLDSVVQHFQGAKLDPFTAEGFFKYAHGVRNSVGLIKMSDASATKKSLRVAKLGVKYFLLALRGSIPFKTIAWYLSGVFFFWPRVRVPDASFNCRSAERSG